MGHWVSFLVSRSGRELSLLSAAAAYDLVTISYYIRLSKLGVRGVAPSGDATTKLPHLRWVAGTLPQMAEIVADAKTEL